ncbi:hypothetical protein GCM10009550_20500 [Actinocorallia libanotica]|uniref:Uncharacterized protein n=1 Tax=Actinocorallia libanotica TaxID=46162 RepID=A0ABN1QRD1_9ACTN
MFNDHQFPLMNGSFCRPIVLCHGLTQSLQVLEVLNGQGGLADCGNHAERQNGDLPDHLLDLWTLARQCHAGPKP